MQEVNLCSFVRESCQKVCQTATNVRINEAKMPQLIKHFRYTKFSDFNYHLNPNETDTEGILLQLFLLDSLNFCFWPLANFQYEQLATCVQKALFEGLTLQTLVKQTGQVLIQKIFGDLSVPLATQKAAHLKQLGQNVTQKYDASLTKVVSSAGKSAVKLLNILTELLPNLRDKANYRGQEVGFYKRGQILVADIWAKFEGRGIGQFSDIAQLTMFPDYRVPQVLHHFGVLEHEPTLLNKIVNKIEIERNSQEEVEIRASTIVAVQQLRKMKEVLSIEMDWFLWEYGEQNLASLPPHHRTLSPFY